MRIRTPGGLNQNDGASVEECQAGYNFELVYGETNYRPRRPIDTKGTSTNAGTISGIMQLIKRDDTDTTLIYEDNAGTNHLYLWDGSTTFTSKRTTNLATGSKLRDVYYSLDDVLVIVDLELSTPLLNWDGTDCIRHKTGLAAGSAVALSSLTSSGTTATATTSAAHGLSTGDLVIIAGATETPYNGEFEITVTGADTFTYTMTSSTTSPATGSPTWDRGVDLYAKYGGIHNGRLWLFNVTTNDGTGAVDTPHLIAVSEFENIESFDTAKRVGDSGFTTGNEAFYILSPDLKPINGVTLFNKNVIISTEDGRIYRLTGDDSTNYAWVDFYAGSAAIGVENMVNFGNDVMYMVAGGNIESLTATNTSGDVHANDLTHWIPELVCGCTGGQMIYDQFYQKVFIFRADDVLVFFKNIFYGYGGKLSPWGRYRTAMTHQFSTNAAKYLRRPGETIYSVYFGDDSGNIYDMNGQGSGDGGSTDIQTTRTNNIIYDLDTVQEIINGQVQYRRKGECEVSLEFQWTNEYNTSNSIITLKGPPAGDTGAFFGGDIYFGGEVYFNEGFAFADHVATRGFSPTGRSPSFIMTSSLITSVRFRIDHIELFA